MNTEVDKKIIKTKEFLEKVPMGKPFLIRDVIPYHDEMDIEDLSEDTSRNPLIYECALILSALGCKVWHAYDQYYFIKSKVKK